MPGHGPSTRAGCPAGTYMVAPKGKGDKTVNRKCVKCPEGKFRKWCGGLLGKRSLDGTASRDIDDAARLYGGSIAITISISTTIEKA